MKKINKKIFMQKLQRFKYKYANGNKIHKGESGYKPSKINGLRGIGLRVRKMPLKVLKIQKYVL